MMHGPINIKVANVCCRTLLPFTRRKLISRYLSFIMFGSPKAMCGPPSTNCLLQRNENILGFSFWNSNQCYLHVNVSMAGINSS